MKLSVCLVIAVLLSGAAVLGMTPEDGEEGFLGFLAGSGLNHLYRAELRRLCVEAGDVSACRGYADLLSRSGRFGGAAAVADSLALGEVYRGFASRLIRAEAWTRAGRYQRASAIADSLIGALPPRDIMVQAVLLRARCQMGLGLTSEALVNLRATEPYVDPGGRAAFAGLLAACEEDAGDLSEAYSLYQLASDAGQPEAMVGLLRLALKQDQPEQWARAQKAVAAAGLPVARVCSAIPAAGDLFSGMHKVLGDYIAGDTTFDAGACPSIVAWVVGCAEAGQDMSDLSSRLLARRPSGGAGWWLRYACSLAPSESLVACDTLAVLTREATDAPARMRSACACLDMASHSEGLRVAADVVSLLDSQTELMDADEVFETSRLLVRAGFKDVGLSYARSLLGDLEPGFDDTAILSVASLMEEAGDTAEAVAAYDRVSGTPLPSPESVEAGRRAYVIRLGTSGGAGIANDLERIAARGASDEELGDLFMRNLKDYARAALYYKRSLGANPDSTETDRLRLKWLRAVLTDALVDKGTGVVGSAGISREQAEVLSTMQALSGSPRLAPDDLIAALDLAVMAGIELGKAPGIVAELRSRDDISSTGLYRIGRVLFGSFLASDGNSYTECVLTLRRVLEEFPGSPEAAPAALLLAGAKFIAGDYVGALEGYRTCLGPEPGAMVSRLCDLGSGECYLHSGGLTGAIPHLKRAGSAPRVVEDVGVCYDLLGRQDSARVYYSRVFARLGPVHIADAARLQLGLSLAAGGETEDALDVVDSPVPAVRLRLRGARDVVTCYVWGRAGYSRPAIRLLRSTATGGAWPCQALLCAASLAAPAWPDSGRAMLDVGGEDCRDISNVFRLLRDRAAYSCASGSAEACRKDRQRFARRFPLASETSADLQVEAVLLMFRDGDPGAEVLLDSLIADGSRSALMPEAIYRKGMHYLAEGDYPEANRAFGLVARDYAESDYYDDACFKLGTGYYLMEMFDSSSYYFDAASRSRDPELRENALFNLGVAREKADNVKGAAESFWQLAVAYPLSDRFERGLLRAGFCFERGGQTERALRIYRAILLYSDEAESQAEATYWAGETLAEMGRPIDAAVEFVRVAYHHPEETAWSGTAMYRAGMECEKAGVVAEALLIYREVVKRFGADTDWGRASGERLIDLGGER